MYDHIYEHSCKMAKHKIWILSDLQQRDPSKAKECLDISMRDFEKMKSPADMIWYLGDAVEGDDLDDLIAMSKMQEAAFEKTNLPLCYVMGNHELDYSMSDKNKEKTPTMPFYEIVKKHKHWHTTENFEDWYYRVEVGDFAVYFMSDHIASDLSWAQRHGRVFGDETAYPYDSKIKDLRTQLQNETKPIITASHYSYAGGNRESEFQSKLLPLPQNVKIHFYGHAHIGDYTWAKEDAYRRISWVNWHDIPQIDVSSFEHIRGNTCRSVFLHIYNDNSFGIFFRNHDNGVFTECYFPAKKQYSAADKEY